MDADTKLELTVVGPQEEDGHVYLTDFREFCDGVESCLRKVEAALTARKGRMRYRIIDLKIGSAKITLEPVRPTRGRDRGPQVVRLFKKTVRAIQTGRKVDRRLSAGDLQSFKKLVSPLGRNATQVWVAGERLTDAFSKNVDKLLSNLIPSSGSVRGTLEKLNVHNTYEFVLYPTIPGHPVNCEFPDSLIGQVRDAIQRSVTVRGTLYFRPDSAFPDKVRVETIDIHPYDDNLPKLLDLRGMAPGLTGGASAVDFVQALRDD